jgi:hypothetical protein
MIDCNYVLLLGAGFTRNWGGWLANEMFEYLLGHPAIDDDVRAILWEHEKYGFESALGVLQAASTPGQPDARLVKLMKGIEDAFADMNAALREIPLSFGGDRERSIIGFMTRFDALFTLNQDLMLEHRYVGDGLAVASNGRWNGCNSPGLKLAGPAPTTGSPFTALWTPSGDHTERKNIQPYYKLHGSSNWRDEQSANMMIVGGEMGDKQKLIDQHPLLKYYFQQLEARLSEPNTRLMVIGYSFRDPHVNAIIERCLNLGNLKVFIIDPHGVGVIPAGLKFLPKSGFPKAFEPHLIGASRRPLRSIFGDDDIEFRKVMRFFAN